MRLIDANIFIYGAGRPHPLRVPSNRVLEAVGRGDLDGNTDVEALQEILNYYHRNNQLDYGRQVFHNALNLFPDAIEIAVSTMRLAEQVLTQHSHLEARDAIHAAVVLEHGLEGIISADRGFDGIPGVTRFDPLEL